MLDYEISPTEAGALYREGKARLIDVREPWEFATVRIDGSVLIPMGELRNRSRLEFGPEERLIVVCHHGIRSMSATTWLREQGFERAQSLRGGLDAWSKEVDPSVGRY
jgi:rhodanese-related sulfurtransferase